MNVKELRSLLEKYPDDMDVVCEKYSDYDLVTDDEIIKGVDKTGFIMRSHLTMSEENKKAEKEYLVLR